MTRSIKRRDVLAAAMALPFLNFVGGLAEIDAWPVIALGIVGISCFAIALLLGLRRLLIVHYAVGFFFLIWIIFPSNPFLFLGPDYWTYRHFADRKFSLLEEGFFSPGRSAEAATKLVGIASSGGSPGVRFEAVSTLGRIGDRLRLEQHPLELVERFQRVAIPCLGKALYDESGYVRRHAALLLQCHGEAAATVVSDLAGRLGECDDTAWFSAEALGDVGPAASPAIPRLLQALQTGCSQLQVRAAEALGRIGGGPAVARTLENAMRSNDKRLASAAKAALNELTLPVESKPSLKWRCLRYSKRAA